MSRSKRFLGGKSWLIALLLVLAAINWAASRWHARLDFTNEKRFTISAPTQKLLRKLDQPVIIDVLLKGNYPSAFRQLAGSSDDMLREFREYAGNKIQFRFVAPDETMAGQTSTYADTLSALGVFPINLTTQLKEGQQQQFVYPVALVQAGERLLPVMLYQGKSPMISIQELNSAEAMLEYNLANGIAKITEKDKPLVAYAIGNDEPGDYSTYDLFENTLKPNYRFFSFNLMTQPVIPSDFKALLVVKPALAFTDEEILKLDQYVMRGGKLLFFVDRLNAEMDSLRIKNEVIAYDRGLELNELLFRYGVRINPDLVMDLQCDYLPFDVNGNGQYEFLPWNYFPVMEAAGDHPISKNLGFVVGRFVNSIDTVEAAGIKKTVLLHTSPNARVISTPALISGAENVNAPEDAKFKRAHIPTAILLEGKFTSLFNNRLSQAMQDSLTQYEQVFLRSSTDSAKVLVAADGDLVLNAIVKGNQPIQMGLNPYTYGTQREFPFANKDFLINALDYMINANGLSEAKSKDYVARFLDTKKVTREKSFWQLINIAVPVLLVLLFALIFQWIRKRRNARPV